MDRTQKLESEETRTAQATEPLEAPTVERDRWAEGRFSPGDRLADRFQIIRWIANGGMGEVYEARDLELDETIAVKIIRPEIATDARVMDRFRREISLARQVTHPNVCRIFDVFYHVSGVTESGSGSSSRASGEASNADHVALLTMELLGGETLSDYLHRAQPLPPQKALPMIRQMVAALSAAHDAGVVHRDFKCGNVMVVEGQGEEPRVVVTDFGLARSALRRSRDVTQQGEILGSPAYMAPEQALGEEITPAVDIYALGVVIYRMVTGQLPFDGPSPYVLLAQRLNEDPLPPRQHVPDLDPNWDEAIMKCLAREPEDRFESTRDLLAVLEPKSPTPSLAAYRNRLWRRFVAWSLGLVGIAGLALYTWHPRTSPAPGDSTLATEARSSVAVLGFNNLTQRADAAWLSDALAELLATELDASEQLRIIPGENVARMRRDLELPRFESMSQETLRRIGRHLGSEYVLLGSYFAGDSGDGRFRLDLKLQSTTEGETITSFSETASEAELLSLVDRLGDGLRRQFGVDRDAGEATTADASMPSNLEAARLYAEGLAKLRSYDVLGARDLLLEAVAADPEYPPALSALAGAYSTLGYEAEAVEQIRSAFEQSRNSPRQERLLIEGQYRELTGDWNGAANTYQTLYETFPDHLEYGLHLVSVQVQGGQPGKAEEALASLRRLSAPSAEDPRIDAAEYELAMALAQFPRALEAARQAVEKSRQIGARWLTARSQLDEGKALRLVGRLAEAEAAARDAHAASLDLGDRKGAATALNLIGTISFYRNDFEVSLLAHDEALSIYRETGSRTGIFGVLNNKAITLHYLGDFEGSAQLREEALDLARAIGAKEEIALSLGNLALSRHFLGDSTTALQLQQESLDIARQIDNPRMISRRLYTIAWLWAERDLNSSRERLQEAVKLFRELDQPADLAMGLRALARLDILQDELASARQNLEASSTIDDEVEEEVGGFETRFFRALLALEGGRFPDAAELAAGLAAELEKMQRVPHEADAQCVLALARLATGQLEAAREALRRASELMSVDKRDGLVIHFAGLEARMLAAEGQPEAALDLLDLELTRQQQLGRLDRQFLTRLTAEEIEWRHDRENASRDRLATLAQEAEAAGFYLIARKARQIENQSVKP